MTTPILTGSVLGTAATSRHWTSARIPCAGNELAMTVILPRSDLGTLLAAFSDDNLSELLTDQAPVRVDLTMPPFSFGSVVPLTDILQDLGMPRAFTDLAEFPGLTTDQRLRLDHVLHQGWVAVDEDGMEAEAATVVTVAEVSAGPASDRTLILDRPFLFCIHDTALGTPLVLGVVNDPTRH